MVITGELADCFSCKSEGIEAISAAVRAAFGCPAHFWGVSGFGSGDLAGANWSASAALLAAEMGDCLFVDMGSTTTDLIPIKGGPLAERTGFLRWQTESWSTPACSEPPWERCSPPPTSGV